ncbi:MAG TPA: DUF3515 domain-containing protein [Amycolatopsis sp.]|uniref:DUF3515 domain-containing protein n=1 Tax=Amycolatopsis sp. TaxID=37632 RepID=UPI002B46C1D3|nr:DUF3515 domain-containing protein [Amycolatopsis sp.]HKS44035.1 DUF3515 domain-containing protein [Amycolatopsis sp.]
MPAQDTGAPPRRLIVLASIVAAVLAAGVAVVAVFAPSNEPSRDQLAVPSVPAPQANEPACGTLLAALPPELTSKGTELGRRELAAPAPPATVAWGQPDAIVLRCGLERPSELTPSTQLRAVSGVEWLPVAGQGTSTWYIVDRAVYIALTVPDSAGTGPLQEISDTVAATLPQVPPRFG